jgi:hypothetical protein
MVSAAMKRAMETATPGTLAMMQVASTHRDFPVAVDQADTGVTNRQWAV